MANKVRKHQIEEWQEVVNAQQSATDANGIATGAQQTADGKIAGFLKVVLTIANNAQEIEQDGFTHEVNASVVKASNIVEVELYENGVMNDDATVTFAADIRQVGGQTVTVTVFTVTNLDNLIYAGDKFTFKCAVKSLSVPN